MPSAAAVLALLLASVWAWRRWPPLGFVGLAFFLILAPTSSVLPIADLAVEHRMYLPLAAVAVAGVVGGYALLEALDRRGAGVGRRPWLPGLLVALLVVVLGGLTICRNADYASGPAIWTDVVRKRPANPRGYYNLGRALAKEGQYDEALVRHLEALRLDPGMPEIQNNLGDLFLKWGDPEQASAYFSRELQLNPRWATPWSNLGSALATMGKLDEGIACFSRALQLDPTSAGAHYNMGLALAFQGKDREAVRHLAEAVRLNPAHDKAQNRLGVLLLEQGRPGEAVEHCRQAVLLEPASAEYHCDLAFALAAQGERAGAAAEYGEGFRLNPSWLQQYDDRARRLATAGEARRRNGRLALRLAREVCQATEDRDAGFLDTRAAAEAERGQFREAAGTARRAADVAEADGRHDLASAIRERLRQYESNRPSRAVPQQRPRSSSLFSRSYAALHIMHTPSD